MPNPSGLSAWVKSKLKKHGGAPYKSNREFASAFDIEPKTVKRLLEGKPVENTTLEKLAAGLNMDWLVFLNFVEDFALNPETQLEVKSKAKSMFDRLSPANQRIISQSMEQMLKEQGNE